MQRHWLIPGLGAAVALVAVGAAIAIAQQPTNPQQPANPRQQPGAAVHIFAPEQHDLYDGHFMISAGRIHMVGTLNDPEGWDHLDNDAKNVRPVAGTAEIDVNEIANTGTFEARLSIPEGNLVLQVRTAKESFAVVLTRTKSGDYRATQLAR